MFISFCKDCLKFSLKGGKYYSSWMVSLLILMIVGFVAYTQQYTKGFQVTNLSDQVSWGAYIANFTFLVGVAAAAVLLVVPSYVFHREDIHKMVLTGEILAISALVMCLLFVMVDLGRPDRFLHIIPFIGRLNFPQSILAWDVIVITIYLLMNLHIPGYLLFHKYAQRKANKKMYLPFVYTSIFWAVSIHTVTAFLYSGFGGRPFWNTSILAARFLVSAFASGPAILLITFHVIHYLGKYRVERSVFDYLKKILVITLPLNLFLFGCEAFKELYTDTVHTVSFKYLYLGLHGHGKLILFSWFSLLLNIFATIVFVVPVLRKNIKFVALGSIAAILGIWIEKGMGLIIPGFIPTPLGDLVEYQPSYIEFFISLGIWAVGAFIFTACVRIANAVVDGSLAPQKNSSFLIDRK